jgi:hypothetical protein
MDEAELGYLGISVPHGEQRISILAEIKYTNLRKGYSCFPVVCMDINECLVRLPMPKSPPHLHLAVFPGPEHRIGRWYYAGLRYHILRSLPCSLCSVSSPQP